MKLFLGLAIAMTMGLSACSEVKKVDEMRDNTREMNETTKTLRDKTGEMKSGLDQMAKTTDQMRDITAEMGKTTASLYDGMRQGDTSALRREFLQRIQNDMTLQGRIGDAGLYLMAFEFQVLGKTGRDLDIEFRDLLYQQAMLEFFMKIDEVAPKHYEVEPTATPTSDPTDAENKASAFNAIAFALHKTNRQQVADPRYGKPMSFYDLIIEALRMKPRIDSGEIVLPEGPHWVKEILARPARVKQLLQTRYNMFVFGMLGLTTNLVEYSKPMQLWKLWLNIDIDLTEKTRGRAGLQYIYEEVVKPAAATANDMLSVGVSPQFEMMSQVVLKSLKIRFHTSIGAEDMSIYTRQETLVQLWARYTQSSL